MLEVRVQMLLTEERGKCVEVWCQLSRGFSQSRDKTCETAHGLITSQTENRIFLPFQLML